MKNFYLEPIRITIKYKNAAPYFSTDVANDSTFLASKPYKRNPQDQDNPKKLQMKQVRTIHSVAKKTKKEF